MKTTILSAVAVIAISASAITAASTASARHGGYPGLGHDYSYYQHGVTERRYRAICKRLHFNWKVHGNLKAKELFFRWNCFKFYRGYGY